MMVYDGQSGQYDKGGRPETGGLSQESRVINTMVEVVGKEQPELLKYWVNRGDLSAWSAVLVAAKPGQAAREVDNRWIMEAVQSWSPEVAEGIDLIEDDGARRRNFQSGETDTWIVNRGEVLHLVKNNRDFFGNGDVSTYDEAKSLMVEALTDSNRRDVATGLMYGYPRLDCERYVAYVMPMAEKLGGYADDAVGRMRSLGFTQLEAKFVDRYMFGDSLPWRRMALSLVSRHIPVTEDQKQALMTMEPRRDKYGTTRWIGFKSSREDGNEALDKINQKMEKSGMGRVLSAIRNFGK